MEEKRYLTMRLYDLLNGKKPEEEKSAQDIIADIKRRIEEGD